MKLSSLGSVLLLPPLACPEGGLKASDINRRVRSARSATRLWVSVEGDA